MTMVSASALYDNSAAAAHETKLLGGTNGYHAVIEVDDDDLPVGSSSPHHQQVRNGGHLGSADGTDAGSGEGGVECEAEGDDEESGDRSFKLHNIWAKFETGQIDSVETKKKLSAEIKELRSDILKMKISKLTNESHTLESVSQNKLDEIEQEKLQELEEIKKARHSHLSDIREKFKNLSEGAEDATPSPRPIDLDLELEEEKDGANQIERKSLMESFKKKLEQGDLEGNQKIEKNEELSQLKTNTSLIRDKILAAQSEDQRPSKASGRRHSPSPPSATASGSEAGDRKVEYVSEPREPMIPNLVRPSGGEASEVECEISRIRDQVAGSTRLFRERFENISDGLVSPSSSSGYVTNATGAAASSNSANDILAEIQRLRAEAGQKSEFVSEGSPLPSDVVRSSDPPSGQSLASDLVDGAGAGGTAFSSTKNRIAKFKELEKGINPDADAEENRIRRPREITPPRDGKVVFENEPMLIDSPNYVRASSATPNEPGGELFQGRESARNLKNMFEQIPNEDKEGPRERPKVKRFTEPRISIPTEGPLDEICVFCEQKVYPTDKMDFNKKAIHRGCFKCKFCKGNLRLENYATHDDDVYCVPHFKMLFANEPGLTQAHKNILQQQQQQQQHHK